MRRRGTFVSLAVFHSIKEVSDAELERRRLPLECHEIAVTGEWPVDCRSETQPIINSYHIASLSKCSSYQVERSMNR